MKFQEESAFECRPAKPVDTRRRAGAYAILVHGHRCNQEHLVTSLNPEVWWCCVLRHLDGHVITERLE